MKKSWKSTLLGILAGLALILPQLVNLLDGKPETVFAWPQVAAGLSAMGLGFVVRDNKRSSEDVGAK